MGLSQEVVQALKQVREGETEKAKTGVELVIEQAMNQLWERIKAQENTYIMDCDEFALFNYHRSRYASGRSNDIAKDATTRYWNNHSVKNGS